MYKKETVEDGAIADILAKRLAQKCKAEGGFEGFLDNFHREFHALREEVLTKTIKGAYGTGDVGGLNCPDCGVPLENKGIKKNEFT